METASLLTARLRKLMSETSDPDSLTEAVRQLLELDRSAHGMRASQDDRGGASVVALPGCRIQRG